jgi:hypothetical protein
MDEGGMAVDVQRKQGACRLVVGKDCGGRRNVDGVEDDLEGDEGAGRTVDKVEKAWEEWKTPSYFQSSPSTQT